MKKILTNPWTYVLIASVLIIAFHKRIYSWWSNVGNADGSPCTTDGKPGHFSNKICIADRPAEGSICNLNGQAGTIINGSCVPAEIAQRTVLVPANSYYFRGRRVRCYTKAPGSTCSERIFDSMLGYGTLQSVTDTSCCYIF